MEKEPKSGDVLQPHEVPPGAGDEEPKGLPTSDRHESETAHDRTETKETPR